MKLIKKTFGVIWKATLSVLTFLGMIDAEGSLSRTNLLIYIFTIKFAFVPMSEASINDLALALAAMGIYMGKKVLSTYENTRKEKEKYNTIDNSAEELYNNLTTK